MSILLNEKTSIIVQGITGSEGLFHAQQMLDYGSNVVCGVTPGKGGQTATENNLPVFNSIKEAKREVRRQLLPSSGSAETDVLVTYIMR